VEKAGDGREMARAAGISRLLILALGEAGDCDIACIRKTVIYQC